MTTIRIRIVEDASGGELAAFSYTIPSSDDLSGVVGESMTSTAEAIDLTYRVVPEADPGEPEPEAEAPYGRTASGRARRKPGRKRTPARKR